MLRLRRLFLFVLGMPGYEYCGLAIRGNPGAQVGLSFRWLFFEPFERGLRSVPDGSES